jgi:hypothetical protein
LEERAKTHFQQVKKRQSGTKEERRMKMEQQEEIRKGPWTEQEDFQLVCFVGLFGDRRWDFIAKVSGLKVAGDK